MPSGLTITDINNAMAYGTAVLNKYLFETSSFPFKSDEIIWNEKKCDYYCPEGFVCPNGTVEFTKKGCETVSCYPYDEHGDVIPTGNFASNVLPEVYSEWDEEKKVCRLSNSYLRMWATHPEKRRSIPTAGITNAPPFIYQKGNKKTPIVIPKNYCEDFMKISFDETNNSCYVGRNQFLAEVFMGTLYRDLF